MCLVDNGQRDSETDCFHVADFLGKCDDFRKKVDFQAVLAVTDDTGSGILRVFINEFSSFLFLNKKKKSKFFDIT